MTPTKKRKAKKRDQRYPEDKVEISSSAKEEESKLYDRDDVREEPEAPEADSGQDEHKREKHLTKKDLLLRLENIEKEKEETQDRLLRTMAEFDNYKKRVSREKEELVKYGIQKLSFELLHVLDNFERALKEAENATEVEPVVEGINMILKQFLSVLENFDIKPFNSLGEIFDPEKHEAIAQQEHDEYDENSVMIEYQKGYMLKDRLLRAARVIVSKGPADEED